MKRIISISILMLFLCIFSGCGPSEKENICSEAHYNYATKAIEIADDYLSYDITAEEAHDIISDLYNSQDTLPDYTGKNKEELFISSHKIELCVYNIYMSLTKAKLNQVVEPDLVNENYNDVSKYRNELKEYIDNSELQ